MSRFSLFLLAALASCVWGSRLDVGEQQQLAIGLEVCSQAMRALPCAPGYASIAGSCYKFHQSPATWSSAQATCQREGGHLASVLNEQQYKGLLDHINARFRGTYWISGAVVGGKWMWTSTGTTVNPKWWGRNAGNSANQCAYFCSNTLKYWNKSCNGRLRFICEINKTSAFPDIVAQ